jgi:hypothetical protein
VKARQLLQSLKDLLKVNSELSEQDIQCSVTSDNSKIAEATICVPVEGKIRLFKVKAVEIGVYEGLEVLS